MLKHNKILVRTPNWLGDLVMSHAFFKQLQSQFPTAEIHVIVKHNLVGLIPLFKMVNQHYSFNKQEFKGLVGLKRFAKSIKTEYDYFFCLPDSFSSAFMGYLFKADVKIGYKNELRSFMLSQSYSIPKNIHRVDKYVQLLSLSGIKPQQANTTHFNSKLPQNPFLIQDKNTKHIAFNPMAVGLGRSFSIYQSQSIIKQIAQKQKACFYIIGTNAANGHANQLQQNLKDVTIKNLCGKTNLMQLAALLQQCDSLLTTDSGPAHLANALATPVTVYFSTGIIQETSPYHKQQLEVLNYSDIK